MFRISNLHQFWIFYTSAVGDVDDIDRSVGPKHFFSEAWGFTIAGQNYYRFNDDV